MNARGPLAALAVCAVLLTGCGNSGRDGKDDLLPTAGEEQVAAQVQRYVDQIVTTVGTGSLQNPDALSGACEGRGGEIAGDDRFTATGGGQIPLPAAQHRTTLSRIHDQWLREGWSITEYRFYPGGATGTVAARNPDDGYQISLGSTDPPTALALSVYSPCYQKPGS